MGARPFLNSVIWSLNQGSHTFLPLQHQPLSTLLTHLPMEYLDLRRIHSHYSWTIARRNIFKREKKMTFDFEGWVHSIVPFSLSLWVCETRQIRFISFDDGCIRGENNIRKAFSTLKWEFSAATLTINQLSAFLIFRLLLRYLKVLILIWLTVDSITSTFAPLASIVFFK